MRVAAAAALVIVAVGGAMVWPRGVRVYAAGNDGLQVTLADDSRVEMRAHAEMTVGRASDGIQIDLKTGDIIVTAAEQHDGHLYVRTKDMTVAVDGTVFLVNASQDGSRVGVIEGEVRVREGEPGKRVCVRANRSRPVQRRLAAADGRNQLEQERQRASGHSRLKGDCADDGDSCADCASRTGRFGEQPGGKDRVRGGLDSTV